jgi:hypothetical protein
MIYVCGVWVALGMKLTTWSELARVKVMRTCWHLPLSAMRVQSYARGTRARAERKQRPSVKDQSSHAVDAAADAAKWPREREEEKTLTTFMVKKSFTFYLLNN